MYIYSSEQVREQEQMAEQKGMPAFTLMELAGRGLFYSIKKRVKKNQTILIMAGKGNNGGDGVVLARYLKQAGYETDLVFPVGQPNKHPALAHLQYFETCGYKFSELCLEKQYDIIVDSLLGTGARWSLSEEVRKITEWANSEKAVKVAVDVPTGVDVDGGKTDLAAFKADYTYCLHGYKPSCFHFPSRGYYGKVEVVDIGLPQTSNWRVWTDEDAAAAWPSRNLNAHKGTFGNGLLIAGSDRMPGSASLAAIGAFRLGIGKLTISTTPHASAVIGTHSPETVYHYREEMKEPEDIEGVYTAVAVGPAMSPGAEMQQMVDRLLKIQVPLILDAGALDQRKYPAERKSPIIVTPHPGEFSRMTGLKTKEILENRIEHASEFAKKNQIIVVLKGQYTVVAFPDGSGYINLTGNAALAKGGSGDVLAGMMLASVTNHDKIKHAVMNAVYLHGACADEWVKENGMTTMVSHDFDRLLPIVCKKLEQKKENINDSFKVGES